MLRKFGETKWQSEIHNWIKTGLKGEDDRIGFVFAFMTAMSGQLLCHVTWDWARHAVPLRFQINCCSIGGQFDGKGGSDQ